MSKKPVKGEYIETDTGNKVSRRSQIIGTTNIILGGKTVIQAEVIIRGDLLRTYPSSSSEGKGNPVAVAIGRYCFFSRGCELRPPGKMYKGYLLFLLPSSSPSYLQHELMVFGSTFSHYPLKIADHVLIGPGTIVEAALIGSHVSIGAGCVIGKFAIIKDYARVLDGTVVPPNMVIPSFSVVGGRPGRVVGEVSEGEVDGFDLREVYRGVGN
ncbi:Trimeric LpxA-like enzyme [Glarea lozoyensis ATCC 20868]|uniref:Dynactin subunit 5 n=1 Tax=Glarea lozoyensis (strain ATCC 20868 / MF5171) TaxID=1116229 RepID=S3D5J5_GLAL2|nr:Trimeric LpxA-like enzyme [Glarea lozoyensis ATCC 20868]EPE27346.1 Trimeric LpxA-like enzyme [Glarea lozoyensis ATCC 20868]